MSERNIVMMDECFPTVMCLAEEFKKQQHPLLSYAISRFSRLLPFTVAYLLVAQGKVQLEVRFDEYLSTELNYMSSHRMAVK